MKKYNKRKIGFFQSEEGEENENDLTPRKSSKGTDPRIMAFARSYTSVVNKEQADEFLLLSNIRKMFNAFPFKDKDPLRELLFELEENGFELETDAVDRMGYYVKRVNFFALQQNNETE